MISDITFEYPYLLTLALLFLICERFCKMRTQSIIFPHLNLLQASSIKGSILIKSLKWITIVAVVVAISSPVVEDKLVLNEKDGYDISLALDSSGSMRELGFDKERRELDKFEVVKSIVADFIDRRVADNISFTLFGDFAYIASPLTYDKDILKDILNRLFIGLAGERTAIYDAIAQSVNLLSRSEAKSKILILLTDGVNTSGRIPPDVAIKLARKHNIKIYTIGIGVDFDKRRLMKIAKESDGEFFEARDRDSLEQIYQKIDSLEKSKIKSNSFIKKDYYFRYPLFIAIISLLLYLYLRNLTKRVY